MSDPLIVGFIGDSTLDELARSYYIDASGIQCNWNAEDNSYETLDPDSDPPTCYSNFQAPGLGPNDFGSPRTSTHFVKKLADHLNTNAYALDVNSNVGEDIWGIPAEDTFPYTYLDIFDVDSVISEEVGVIGINAALYGSGLWEHWTYAEDIAYYTGMDADFVASALGFITPLMGSLRLPDGFTPAIEDRISDQYQDVLNKADILVISIFANDFMQAELTDFWFTGNIFFPWTWGFDGKFDAILFRESHGNNYVSPGCDLEEPDDDNPMRVSNCNLVFQTIASKMDNIISTFNQDPLNTQPPLINVHNIMPSSMATDDSDDYMFFSYAVDLSANPVIMWGPTSDESVEVRSMEFWATGYNDVLEMCILGNVKDDDEYKYFVAPADANTTLKDTICDEIIPYDNVLISDTFNNLVPIIKDYLTGKGVLVNEENINEYIFASDLIHLASDFASTLIDGQFEDMLDFFAGTDQSVILSSADFDLNFNQKVYKVLAPSCGTYETVDLYTDCLGECGGSALFDNCDTCDIDATNDCTQDCAGTWGGSAVEDGCGVCDADSTNDCHSPTLCAGDINEDTIINVLDVISLVNKVLADEPASPISDLIEDGILNASDVIQLVNLVLNDLGPCNGNEVCGNNFTADCSSPSWCVANDFLNNTTCDSDNPDYLFNFECVESDCENFECGTIPNGDTCTLLTSCDDLATALGFELVPFTTTTGSWFNFCVVNNETPDPDTECFIYSWDESQDNVENFKYKHETILDCDGKCMPFYWIGNGICSAGGGIANLDCPVFNCDGGDCGTLQLSESGDCGVPDKCADLAYVLGVEVSELKEVGFYGCSVIDDPNFSVIGASGCPVYSWNEDEEYVDNFIYTVETVVDCNSTCTFSSFEADGYCDDVDMAFGSHLDCVEFDCDGGDCETELPTDGSQDCVPTRESDWIGDNGQYTDPDDDGLF